MDWITGLQKAIDYVEEHLEDDLDYMEIARQAASSNVCRMHSTDFGSGFIRNFFRPAVMSLSAGRPLKSIRERMYIGRITALRFG